MMVRAMHSGIDTPSDCRAAFDAWFNGQLGLGHPMLFDEADYEMCRRAYQVAYSSQQANIDALEAQRILAALKAMVSEFGPRQPDRNRIDTLDHQHAALAMANAIDKAKWGA